MRAVLGTRLLSAKKKAATTTTTTKTGAQAAPAAAAAEADSLASFWMLWHAATWLARHRRFCVVGCVLIEYVTKVIMAQMPPGVRDECTGALALAGVDVNDVSLESVGTAALQAALPAALATTSAGFFGHAPAREGALRLALHAALAGAPPAVRQLGDAAAQAYLSHPHDG